MAYTTPSTWTSGQRPTAAELNQQLRDNVSFLANPPAVRARHGADQSMTYNTATTVTFTATDSFDTNSMHDTVTNPQRITFNTAGLYYVTFYGILAAANDYDHAGISICKNALLSGEIIDGGLSESNATRFPVCRASGLYKFAAGDWVSVYIKQVNASAANRNLLFFSDRSPIFTAAWLGHG